MNQNIFCDQFKMGTPSGTSAFNSVRHTCGKLFSIVNYFFK